jgi:acetate kinase
MNTLVVNCGSSSIKFALIDNKDIVLIAGKHERLANGDPLHTHDLAIADMLKKISVHRVDIVGHRIVHGGSVYAQAALIDDEVIAEIERHIPDAPMHNPFSLVALRAVQAALPSVPHVALFDTAFHARMPRRATTYAIDHDVAIEHGIRRYGFHGISHEYAAGIAATFLQRPLNELRIITLHLGNGASACAVEFGRSAETSMGNTPLEGLVMGTRSGDVDAGVLLSLLRAGYDAAALDELLNRKSGLAGLSGLGNDLREIERAAAEGDDRSRLAINVFAHRARKYIGAYAAAMGGVDAIVFTGGIGENSASMRGRILQRLEFLGVILDEDRNRDASVRSDDDYALITTPRSRVEAIVVKTNEELMIARQARALIMETRTATTMSIPIAISARHCHLTASTFAALFGAGTSPTPGKPLSQPGQYACEERVNLIGPRDRIDDVRVLGPLRNMDQVEISRTDEFHLGVDAPVRDSGNVVGSAGITLEGPAGTVRLAEGLICARRHIHMHPDDAERFGVSDKDEVSVAIVGGERDLVFGDVLIRVNENYALEMHIDTDEANAAELNRQAAGAMSTVDVDDEQYQVVSTATASLGDGAA